MKTIYTFISDEELPKYLQNEWVFISKTNYEYLTNSMQKEVPDSVFPPCDSIKSLVNRDKCVRYSLIPVSLPECLAGPYHDYYALLLLLENDEIEEDNEHLYELWCEGNDDCSWLKTFDDIEEGIKIIDYLESQTEMPFLPEFLHMFNFEFMN